MAIEFGVSHSGRFGLVSPFGVITFEMKNRSKVGPGCHYFYRTKPEFYFLSQNCGLDFQMNRLHKNEEKEYISSVGFESFLWLLVTLHLLWEEGWLAQERVYCLNLGQTYLTAF